jgi:hypothetical protein
VRVTVSEATSWPRHRRIGSHVALFLVVALIRS